MAVTIRRKTGWFGLASGINIIVNGHKIDEIAQNHTVKIDIPGEQASLQVSQTGLKSKEIVVKHGDVVEIGSTNWTLLYLLIILLSPIWRLFLSDLFVALLMIIIFVVSIAQNYFINGFHFKLEKVLNREEMDVNSSGA